MSLVIGFGTVYFEVIISNGVNLVLVSGISNYGNLSRAISITEVFFVVSATSI